MGIRLNFGSFGANLMPREFKKQQTTVSKDMLEHLPEQRIKSLFLCVCCYLSTLCEPQRDTIEMLPNLYFAGLGAGSRKRIKSKSVAIVLFVSYI